MEKNKKKENIIYRWYLYLYVKNTAQCACCDWKIRIKSERKLTVVHTYVKNTVGSRLPYAWCDSKR